MSGPKLDPSDTLVDRVAVKVEQRTPTSRWIENGLAVVGIAQAALYGTVEALNHAGISLGSCTPSSGFPWITLVIFVGCVLPKTVGRASAGKVWELIGGRIGSKS